MAYAELVVADRDPTPTDVAHGIVVDAPWNETPLLKQVPGARHVRGVWYVPRTYAAVVQLRGVFGSAFTYGPLLTAWLWEERRRRIDPLTYLRDLTELPESWESLAAEFPPGMRKFQVAGAVFLLLAGEAVLGDDMGTGKTVTSLGALARLGASGLPALVVCPNGVKRHWRRLAARWCPNATPYLVTGGAKERQRTLEDARRDPTALVIMNVEAVRSFSRLAPYGSVKLVRCIMCDPNHGVDVKVSQCQVHPKQLNGFGFRTVIQDEVHRISNPIAQQTRAMWATFHDPSVVYRWGLSGTLADQPDKLWSIMHAVCPSEYPVKTPFMDRYALLSWAASGGVEVVGLRADNRAELFRFFDARYRRMPKELVLPQLPPKVRVARNVALTPAQRRVYAQINRSNVTRLESGELLITPSNMTAATRLMQAAAGTLDVEIDPDKSEDDLGAWHVRIKEPSPKMDELEQIVDELEPSERFVVAAAHVDVVAMACARLTKLGVAHAPLTGAQSEAERDQAIQWLESGRIRAIVFTIQAGSESHDMAAASTLIALQRAWTYRQDSQMLGRVQRLTSVGRHEFIRVIDVITEDTVEVDQVDRLYERYELADQINRDRARLASAGIDVDLAIHTLETTSLGVPLRVEDLTTTASM